MSNMEETAVGVPFGSPVMSAINKVGDPENLCVAVEFECDGCCKKALNAKIVAVIDGFLILVGFNGKTILVKTISGGKLVEKEIARAIIIPLGKICSIEIDALQVDP
ncbi:MAG: hypothetical protein H5U02_08955 [Clostridia bacterium]|nr:hypothetical protein [Clostridia bacterium]